MTKTKHIPVRTCVGCGVATAQPSLVRIAVLGNPHGGRVVVDHARRLAGRGAYVHASGTCASGAARGLSRTLRRSVTPAVAGALALEITRVTAARSD